MKDIVLTGPKYSGKTSAGRAIASLRSLEFIDMDESIFQRTGKSPRQLYSESKANFQKAEAETAEAVFTYSNYPAGYFSDNSRAGAACQTPQRVIAAGGGIIDNPEAVAKIKNINSIIVCLNISADCAWNRIMSNGRQDQFLTSDNFHSILPPFLQTENPQETHRSLHEQRAAAYMQVADIVIEVNEKKPEEIAAEILERIGK